MAEFNYARLKATADRLITRFGKTTTSQLVQPGSKSGNAFNPTIGAATLHAVKAVVLEYNQRDIDGTRIIVGDRKVYVAVGNTDFQITPEWKLKIKMKGDAAAKNYSIVNVKPLEPGDVTLLWELQCRAA